MFYEGRQIGGYTLLRKLGRGGFGEVWLAEKRSQFVTKKVAVKLPLDEQVNFDAIRQEAELWEQASGHPNVLPIIDADIIDSQVVIVSEYADGGSLADRLKRDGQLPLQKAVEMTIGVLNGLEFLHNRRIIHRDIKPQNILLQGDTPRLADFGISRAMNTTIVSSAVIGTDAYMSPESFDGKRTVQTDIWSVGVVLYALLADRLPFPQEHPSERMFAILTRDFEPLPAEVPQNLQRIVARALAKQPENRYQTTADMRDELQKVLLGIAHPTFAPTEVFQIRTENLPTMRTLENRSETGESEKETVVNAGNAVPPPTVPVVEQESVVTNFRENPPTNEPAVSPTQDTNKPPAVRFQMPAGQMPDRPPAPAAVTLSEKEKSTEFKFVVGLVAALIVIFGISFYYSKKGSVFSYSSNSSTVSSSNNSPAASRNTSTLNSPFPLIIELKTENFVVLRMFVDGRNESESGSKLIDKKFTAQQSFELGYASHLKDEIRLKINGKDIILPEDPDGTVSFVITKDNYQRVLQTGGNTGKMIINTNGISNSANNSAYNSVENTINKAADYSPNRAYNNSVSKASPSPNTKTQREEKIRQSTSTGSKMCRSIYFGRSIPAGANVTAQGCVHCESSLAVPNTRCPF